MNHENKRTKHNALGDHVSSKQQMIHELVNPEIDIKRKKAIAKSPKIREEDFVTDPLFPRAYIQFKKGANKEKFLARLKENYGFVPDGLVMKSITVK